MLEQVIKHTTGRFTRCRNCGAEPRHVRIAGRTSGEPMRGTSSIRHYIECRCGARTARHDDLAGAEAEWGSDYAQLSLPLIQKRRRRRKAAA